LGGRNRVMPNLAEEDDDPMAFTIEAVHHVGLVVRDLQMAEKFYVGVLGLRRHPVRANWIILNEISTLHLIPLADPSAVEAKHHAYRHIALQVNDLRKTLHHLLSHQLRVTQVDFNGKEREITDPDDPLDFGVGTLFIHDPDGNLIEFVQIGHGIYT
jgi:catechol 2,3-dioxygenase-like lactoylglutathione lyase family enzyme